MKLGIGDVHDYLYQRNETFDLFDSICRTIDISSKKILLFNLPNDTNLGDNAQTVCIMDFLTKIFTDRTITTFPVFPFVVLEDMIAYLNRLKYSINDDDYIFFHSGYHISDIHCNKYSSYSPACIIQMAVLNVFQNNKIFYMPQTINLTNEHAEEYFSLLKHHNNIRLLCRDPKSKRIADGYLDKSQTFLVPDIVTSLIGRVSTVKLKHDNKVAGMALRNINQPESILTDASIDYIRNELIHDSFSVEFCGTTLSEPRDYVANNRKKLVEAMISRYSSYDLLITDLFHGMVFALIADTPVIVIGGSDHKVSSALDFFKEFPQYGKSLLFIGKLDELEEAINKIMTNVNGKKSTTDQLACKYFDRFKENYLDGFMNEY